jgi:hypothetical protein
MNALDTNKGSAYTIQLIEDEQGGSVIEPVYVKYL